MKRAAMVFVSVLVMLLGGLQGAAAGQIEAWKSGESIRYVDRNDKGQFVGWGELRLESWSSDERSVWVARRSDGTFVTGFKGKLEKFRIDRGKPERTRLVIRDRKGQFVTWADLDAKLSAGWEKWDDNSWRYVVRYQGKFVNWAKPKLEIWLGFGTVLVVRDSSDGENNGKLLTWVAPEMIGSRTMYRDPRSGKFIAAYRR